MGDNLMPKNANTVDTLLQYDISSQNNTTSNPCLLPTNTYGYNGVTYGDNLMPKNAGKFYCEKCDFICSKQSNWNQHIITQKHQNGDKFTAEYICHCGKTYKHRQGLSRHKNKCTFLLESKNHSSEPSPPQQQQQPTNSNTDNSELVEKMFTMFTQMMTHNQDFMQNVIGKVQGINNNSHNTNHFNINMFLNEQCKNAMNIGDFIKSLPITAQHYENTKDNGLTDTLTNIMVDGLNSMDVVERPIHCTDKKRKVMYVKDDDKWDKDDDNNLILKNLKDLSVLHGQNLKLWQEKNPKYETVEKLQIELTNIISELYTNILEERKPINKFINTLTNSTYLNDDMKEQYKKK